MSASPSSRWPAESVAAIRSLAGEGLSGREISDRFGVSRNTIIGVCYRNKISLGGNGTLTQKRSVNASVPTLALKRKEARQRRSAPVKAITLPIAPVFVPEHPAGIPIHKLTNSTCHWPVHDTLPGRYCGEHTDAGSYCAHHHARAYRGLA
jgi:Uncharacterized protein conserved in bacteria